MYSVSFSQNPYRFFSNSPWIHYVFGELTMNSLLFLRIYYDFTICSVNSLWIQYFLITDIDVAFCSQVWLFNVHFWPFLTSYWTWCRRYLDWNLTVYPSICIYCIYGHGWDFWVQNDPFWPQNDLFWPFRWPWMTMIFTPLESK